MTKYTRQEYMANKCTHDDYYRQFVTRAFIQRVASGIGVAAIKASKDRHFNDIPLRKWDALSGATPQRPNGYCDVRTAAALKAAGDFATLGELVCIHKAAAKLIRDDDPSTAFLKA